MDLNWCPVCEQHIPLAWESSLYCSDRCKKADVMASHPALGYTYPADLQSFPRQKNSAHSPMSSPTLTSISPASSSAYPSPPTSPMTNYVYNKTSSGRISPPAFSLGHPAEPEMRRKAAAGPQYTLTTTTNTASKKGFFW
ncbi:hypothetical protein BGZ65_005588 [Modicella reniformis]|uniref:Uncharacterized protein n=1 Tax=Modicella reniformis TaxID=1440133 RepID=A0A9P6IXK6_9FUNG|nr:hypothetical protein BGZ65_005588 [Modicella reniformis]